MKSSSYFTALVALIPLSSAGLLRNTVKTKVTHGKRVTESIAITSNFVTLKKTARNPNPQALHSTKRLATEGSPGSGSVGLRNNHDIFYIIDLTVGNQTIAVSVDTGSSDTWFIKDPLDCFSFSSWEDTIGNCGFGPGFKGNFSEGDVPDETFNRAYTDGTFVSGYFGFDEVTLAGLRIHHQQLAMVQESYWYGDNQTSGLLGLAYPLMTGIDGGVPQYDPVFTSMWKQNLSAPIFSIGLSRGDANDTVAVQESYLAFGGVPPMSYDDSSWMRTPIQTMMSLPSWGITTPDHGLYIIIADAYIYGPANNLTKNETQFPVTIDAGSTLTTLPTEMVTDIYNAFDPPAQYVENQGFYYAACNATVPSFGLQIGDGVFYIDREDMLRQSARDTEGGTLCRVGVTDGGDDGPYVLGVTFLTNVVAVFDVGANEMRFAARGKY